MALTLSAMAGCAGESTPSGGDSGPTDTGPQVYEADWDGMQAFFADHCDSCHPAQNGIDLRTECVAAAGDSLGDGDDALMACFAFPNNDNPEPGGALALTADGARMFIADSENHIIRVLDMASGVIETVAGKPGVAGDADGAGEDALFSYPTAFALDDASGQLFVADANNHKVRVIDIDTYEVSTFAGTGEPSCDLHAGLLVPVTCDNQHDGGDGGPALEATLYRPFGVDLDNDGNLVVSDTYNHRIRVIYR